MLYLNIAEGCAPTGNILRDLLRSRNLDVRTTQEGSEAVVCWGNGYTGHLPSLNRNATKYNKFEQLRVLSSAPNNLKTVPYYAMVPSVPLPSSAFPVFMRKFSHAGGTDIRLALEPAQAHLYARSGWNFATTYIPNETEFRVWVYRRQHLGTYEKHLARPAEFLASRRFGANFDNGYAFRLVPSAEVPRQMVELASAAIQALELDFGAVDILKGRDGQFYILEVNTAPGVEGPDRQVIQALADKITYWVEHNYLRRTGDEAAYERPARTPRARITGISAAVATEETPRMVPGPRRGETLQAWFTRIQA